MKGNSLSLFYFNPRSPCGERLGGVDAGAARLISTHAPLAGSDLQ